MKVKGKTIFFVDVTGQPFSEGFCEKSPGTRVVDRAWLESLKRAEGFHFVSLRISTRLSRHTNGCLTKSDICFQHSRRTYIFYDWFHKGCEGQVQNLKTIGI